jgi:3-oxo-5alpha-steroid 4-dehydrogenase
VREHRWLSGKAAKANLYHRSLGKRMGRRLLSIEQRYARSWTVRADRGVVLAAGGFVFNRQMVEEHAPAYLQGLPLGTVGDDGSGIRLGRELGAATRDMDRVSAWRFFTPPAALAKGVLVGLNGERVCNESLYGAAVGERVVHEQGGRAHLLVDQDILDEAKSQVPSQTLWFQRLQAMTMFGTGRVEAPTVAEAAVRAGVDASAAEKTLSVYNEVARNRAVDPLGKPADLVQPLERPPFTLIDVSVRTSLRFPCPTMTLGGLVVDENTGHVRRDEGSVIPGLYAAGRTAAGICSKSYVSGLSLADCVFSGRRAGTAAAANARSADAVP